MTRQNNGKPGGDPDDQQLERPALLDVEEVAQRLGVCEQTVRNLCSRRKLGHYKVEGLYRITENDVTNYLASRRYDMKGDVVPTPRRPKLKHLKI